MNNAKVMIYLSSIKGVGKAAINNLQHQNINGAENMADLLDIAKYIAANNPKISLPSNSVLRDLASKAELILEKNELLGIATITKFDKSYPIGLKKLNKPAPFFFAKGNINALQMPSIAIIGTRQASPLGMKIGERFGEVAAENEFSVVSGLAEGCDTAGHRGCLNAHGITVAIVATPLDKVFPKSNEALYQEILDSDGCAISEYPLGTQTNKFAFVERDRLQCSLANGIIVVEAGLQSGTYNAINGAKALNKLIGCFQFKQTHYEKYKHSLGNKKMIEDGSVVHLSDAESVNLFMKKCKKNRHCNVKYETISLFAKDDYT